MLIVYWLTDVVHLLTRGHLFNALQFNGDSRSLIENAYGGTGNDWLYGNSANNYLDGSAGNDHLLGYGGNDPLVGGSDDDNLTGGSGVDTLWGNRGADNFIFNYLSEGIDIIKDFQSTEGDQIQIYGSRFGASSTSQFSYNSSTGGLFFEPSGTIGSIQFATIENKPSVFSVALDIEII